MKELFYFLLAETGGVFYAQTDFFTFEENAEHLKSS